MSGEMSLEEFLKENSAPKVDANSEEYSRYESAVAASESKGCIVVRPKQNELFLDIDSAEDLARFYKNHGKVREIVDFTYVKTESPSGRKDRYHIVCTMSRDLKDDYERILLQSLLGSDLTREVLSWQRATRGDSVPTLFFEKKA